MKIKSKALAKWFPPQTAQKGDGDWNHGDVVNDQAQWLHFRRGSCKDNNGVYGGCVLWRKVRWCIEKSPRRALWQKHLDESPIAGLWPSQDCRQIQRLWHVSATFSCFPKDLIGWTVLVLFMRPQCEADTSMACGYFQPNTSSRWKTGLIMLQTSCKVCPPFWKSVLKYARYILQFLYCLR